MMLRKLVASTVFAVPLLFTGNVYATPTTVIEVHLGGTNSGAPDVQLSGGVFGTINDGDGATTGNQNTDVLYDNSLNSQTDIVSGASFTLSGITLAGTASALGGGVITQGTTGGSFSLYNSANSLLLSGTLGDGTLFGSDTNSIGSFFNTTVGSLTGGSLLAFLPDVGVSLGFSLGTVTTGGFTGLDIVSNNIADFTANGTGLIDVVPEPASMTLLISGLLGGVAARRKKAKTLLLN